MRDGSGWDKAEVVEEVYIHGSVDVFVAAKRKSELHENSLSLLCDSSRMRVIGEALLVLVLPWKNLGRTSSNHHLLCELFSYRLDFLDTHLQPKNQILSQCRSQRSAALSCTTFMSAL